MISVVAVILGYSVLIPHVSIDISEPSDRSDPFSAIATIRNIGIVPLWNIVPSVRICDVSAQAVEPPTEPECGSSSFGPSFIPVHWPRKFLGMDKKYDVPLNDFSIGRNVTYAEIYVVVSFRPWNVWGTSTDFKLRTR